MPKRNQHIVLHPQGWAVKKEGSNRVTAIFDTQGDAIEYGRHLAIQQRCDLVIFNRKGVERERRNYRRPRPPRYYFYDLPQQRVFSEAADFQQTFQQTEEFQQN